MLFRSKKIAQNLAGYMSEEWLKEFIKNPADPRFYGTRNKMPAFDKFTDKELHVLIQYLLTLSKDRILISGREQGKETYVFGLTYPRKTGIF